MFERGLQESRHNEREGKSLYSFTGIISFLIDELSSYVCLIYKLYKFSMNVA